MTCATCYATLVDSLPDEKGSERPRLLWTGRDSIEFDLVVQALRQAQIPANAEQGLGGLMGSLLHSMSSIRVLPDDFSRALEIAGAAIAARQLGRGATQICHACSQECSAALTVCPKCKAVLIVEPEQAETYAATAARSSANRRYCPSCDAAYSADRVRCTICGVDLVPEELRGAPRTERERNEPIEIIWRGGDPVAVSEVVAALREAGIRHSVLVTRDYYVFGLAMPQPRNEVRVFASDVARARDLLAGIPQGFPFGGEQSPDRGEEPSKQEATAKRDTRGHWNPAAATVDVWSGEDAALLRFIEDSLRENQIGVRRGGREPGMMRLSVMPGDETTAREIVREILEGSPPA
jgi:hypothetical protein